MTWRKTPVQELGKEEFRIFRRAHLFPLLDLHHHHDYEYGDCDRDDHDYEVVACL